MTWHHDAYLFGEPYPTRNPVPQHFRTGEVNARDLMKLPQDQASTALAAHELGHALVWLAAGLHVSRASIVSDGRSGGHAGATWTGVANEGQLQAVGVAAGERAQDRWLREAGLWTPERGAVTELGAFIDRTWLLENSSPRLAFGTGRGPDFMLLHDMADEALDRVWGRLTAALPVLVQQGVMSGRQLADFTGLPLPQALTGR